MVRGVAWLAFIALAMTGCGQKVAHVPAPQRAAIAGPAVTAAATTAPAPAPTTPQVRQSRLAEPAAPRKPAPTPSVAQQDRGDHSRDANAAAVHDAQPSPAPRTSPEPRPAPAEFSTPRPAQDDPGKALWNRGFASVRLTEGGEPRPLVPGTRVELAFEERLKSANVIRWRSGCNISGGEVTVTRRRLLVEASGGTDMGCPEERHEQDDWVRSFFGSDPTWELDGNRLRLISGDTVIDFERTRYW